jgi:hypothetical protein
MDEWYTEIVGASGIPVLDFPYTVQVLDLGATGAIDFSPNWSGASTYSITGLPSWMTQSGDSGAVTYTSASWGGQWSDNSIGGGRWAINVQAIDASGLLSASTSIWVYIRP